MKRRDLLLAGLAALAQGARAQPGRAGRPYRVVVPFRLTPEGRVRFVAAFAVHGWKEGREFVVLDGEHDWGDRMEESLRGALAKRPDVLHVASTAYALAAHRLSKTVPIVMFSSGYPVEAGVAESLARPGRNVTGNSVYAGVGFMGKLMELVREAKPGVHRVGFLWTYVPPLFPVEEIAPLAPEMAIAARQLALEVHRVDVLHARDIDQALASCSAWGAEALVLTYGPAFFPRKQDVLAYAAERRWPTVIENAFPAEDKGRRPLMTYAPSWDDLRRQAVDYIVRILRDGTKPGDLPIQQPAKFDLTVDLRMAAEIGVRLPQSLLVRADKVVE